MGGTKNGGNEDPVYVRASRSGGSQKWWKSRQSIFKSSTHQPAAMDKEPTRSGFLTMGQFDPAMLSLIQILLIRAGIETNPGPPEEICPICGKEMTRRQSCIWCHHGGWVHTRCTGTKARDWNDAFICQKCSWCGMNKSPTPPPRQPTPRTPTPLAPKTADPKCPRKGLRQT